MTAIAQTLDDKLKQWRPETAQRVEQLVREIMELADREMAPAAPSPAPAHRDRKDDPFFADKAVWMGPVPSDLSANHDKYLYDEET